MSATFGSMSSPANQLAAVTPSDTVNFTLAVRGLYVGVTGNVVVVDKYDNAVTFIAVPAGAILPIAAKRVNATSTTATDIVALG